MKLMHKNSLVRIFKFKTDGKFCFFFCFESVYFINVFLRNNNYKSNTISIVIVIEIHSSLLFLGETRNEELEKHYETFPKNIKKCEDLQIYKPPRPPLPILNKTHNKNADAKPPRPSYQPILDTKK